GDRVVHLRYRHTHLVGRGRSNDVAIRSASDHVRQDAAVIHGLAGGVVVVEAVVDAQAGIAVHLGHRAGAFQITVADDILGEYHQSVAGTHATTCGHETSADCGESGTAFLRIAVT